MTTQAKATRKLQNDMTTGRTNLSGIGFRNPVDLAVGKDGEVYVISRATVAQEYGTRITWFDVNEEFHGEFGHRGSRDGEFLWPVSATVSSDVRLFVSDDWLSRISIFGRDGKFLSVLGTKGTGDGEMDSPIGIAFDPEDNL